MVVSELRGEKIDIIPWNQEPARFVAKALSPARVREVYLDDAQKEATVVVPDDQLALAIGKEGMNARLAHRLTGWKIDIVSDTEFAQQEAEAAFGGESGEEGDFSGRCSAVLSNGKRCPNAALPGSKYCGVPAHQDLALHEPDGEVNPIVAEFEPELEAIADLTEPEAVTEDSAEFGDAEAAEFPAGPGDLPVAGEDGTLETGAAAPVRVEDDPDDGMPIVHITHQQAEEAGLDHDD
jgi:N utilization substance protein A